MIRKYIKQIDSNNFFYPNYEKAEYDVEIVHNINNNCVSGDVTNFSAVTISSSSLTFSIDSTWNLNGAEPFINDANDVVIYSIHMLAPSQVYFKPWRMIESRVVTGATGTTTFSETGKTFTVTSTQAGVSGFTNGTYYFEVRFIGHDCVYTECFNYEIVFPSPTPSVTPSITPTMPPPTPSITPTPSPPQQYTIAAYASTESAISPGPNGVALQHRINSGTWVSTSATVSSDANSPSFMLNITVNAGDDLEVGLRDIGGTNNITAGYSTTIPATTTGTCGRTSPQLISNINSSFSIYLNAQIISNAVVTC